MLDNRTMLEFAHLLLILQPDKKEFQSSSFKTQQRDTYQERGSTVSMLQLGPSYLLALGIQLVIISSRYLIYRILLKSLEHPCQSGIAHFSGFLGLAQWDTGCGNSATSQEISR